MYILIHCQSTSLFNPSINPTQDVRPLQEDMCDFYASGSGYAYDSYYTEVTLMNMLYTSVVCQHRTVILHIMEQDVGCTNLCHKVSLWS